MSTKISRRNYRWNEERKSFEIISPYEIKEGDLIEMIDADGWSVNKKGFLFKATSDAKININGSLCFESIDVRFVYPEECYDFIIMSWNNSDKYKGECYCRDKSDCIRLFRLNLGVTISEEYGDVGRMDNCVVERENPLGKRELLYSCYYPEAPEEIEE